jgi:hypothetical protein
MYPYLAEYHRRLVVDFANSKRVAHPLFDDTGGYAAANLYACEGQGLMLESYVDEVFIDTAGGTVNKGGCPGTRLYLGVFDVAGSSGAWRFLDASVRSEAKLEMKGG